MTIFEHPHWPTLLPHLYIDQGKKQNPVNGPRHRIQVRKTAPELVFAIEVNCPACGALMHSVRQSKRGFWAFNVACPLKVRVECSRSPAAHALANAVREAMGAAPLPPGLFSDGNGLLWFE